MAVLVKIAQFILSISILVILHEFGHFLFAKLFKTRVEKFYLFFNPWFSLFKFKKGETEYGMGWLPLGGYVKISGMIDESMDKEQMKQPPKPYEFRSKKSWQRLLIMLGGVMVNFLTALVIFSLTLFVWGEQYLPTKNVKDGIMVDSLAYEIGLRNGDKILTIDNEYIENFDKITAHIILNESKTIQVDRNGEKLDVEIPGSTINSLINEPRAFMDVRIPFIIGELAKESAAEKAGIQKGDRLISINDSTLHFFDEFKEELANHKSEKVVLGLIRESDTLNIDVNVDKEGKIGVYAGINYREQFELKELDYSLMESIPAGIKLGFTTLVDYTKQLKLIFKPETGAYKSLGGFITIGSIFPGQWNWHAFWNLTALLSIILAIMNVLPIPALDGGHVMFLLYEMITGRKPSDKFLEYAQIAGMIILLALLLYANGNDVIRHIINK